MNCERCQQEAWSWRCSWFDTSMICEECQLREEQHPLFDQAREAEDAAVKAGDWNFPGIGLPPELVGGGR